MTDKEIAFYTEAIRKFAENVDWMAFDEFSFGSRSPLYKRHDTHQAILKDPLYLVLKDMWLQLGVQQGKIKRSLNERRTKESEEVCA